MTKSYPPYSWIVRDNFGGDSHWSYYGCYDGHGGRQVVDFTVANLHDIFANELRSVNFTRDANGIRGVFERSFQTIDNQLRQLGAWHCGTTCTVGLIFTNSTSSSSAPNRTLYIGNVGDSRASIVNVGWSSEMSGGRDEDYVLYYVFFEFFNYRPLPVGSD